jgi:ABC-type sulfate transport system permease subunit
MGSLATLAVTTITTTTTTTSNVSSGTVMIMWLIYAVVILILLASLWKIFTKANKPGWAAIVPIYNLVVELEIIGRPVWWIALSIVPVANLIVAIIILFDLAKAFGKGTGFGVFMLFFPFIAYPMLAFGKAQYVGVNGQGGAMPKTPMSSMGMGQQQMTGQPMPMQQPMQPPMQPPMPPQGPPQNPIG